MQFDYHLKQCPICNSSAIYLWKNKSSNNISFGIYKCNNCTGGFLNPRPSDEILERIYCKSGHGLYQAVTYDEILYKENEFPNSSVDAERMFGIIRSLMSSDLLIKLGKQQTLIDIGSGFGFFSLFGAKNGFKVLSINPGEYENRVCQEMFHRNGLTANIQIGMFEHLNIDNETFAVAIASQVLEHIKNPRSMIMKIDELLLPKGVLAIAVPNFQSLFVRLIGINERGCLWIPEHCNYFTEQSLRSLVFGTRLKLAKIVHVAKIPYYAISERLSLRKGTIARKLVNSFVRAFQHAPCRAMEYLGIGNYLNAFYIKE